MESIPNRDYYILLAPQNDLGYYGMRIKNIFALCMTCWFALPQPEKVLSIKRTSAGYASVAWTALG
jgi:hypothetical protein